MNQKAVVKSSTFGVAILMAIYLRTAAGSRSIGQFAQN